MAVYPSGAASDSDLYVAVNNKNTTLVGALTATGGNYSATEIEVADTTGFPSTGLITIDTEVISYTGVATSPHRFTGITRGQDGTTAASHSNGAVVYHHVVAAHHNVLKEEVKALETNLLPGQHTGTSTNDNASTGAVGEFIISTVGNTAVPATDTWGDITSISLTSGDWDVTLTAGINSATYSGIQDVQFGLGTASGNTSPGSTQLVDYISMYIGTGHIGKINQTLTKRFSLSTTTTIYAKHHLTYSSGSHSSIASIRARRVR